MIADSRFGKQPDKHDSFFERLYTRLYTTGPTAQTEEEIPPTTDRHRSRSMGGIDKVAYVRFASVYRSFEDVDEFRQLIRDI